MKKLCLPILGAALLLASCGGGGAPPSTPDTTAPTVNLTAAQSGTTVNLSATASDNVGVTKVEFYRGQTLISTDAEAPYTASFAVTSSDNGQLNVTARAYDAAGNQGQGGAQVTVNVARTPTLYQGVWGWAAVNLSGQVVGAGALILFDETETQGRKVASGVYTTETQSQTGATLLGPISAAGELETGFTYDLSTTDARIYLVASDDDARLEVTEDGPFFFGEGALFNRTTQQPSQAVYVGLLQVSSEVPDELAAQAVAKTDARALAAQAVQRHFRTGANLQAQTSKASGIRQGALNLLERR